MYTGSNVLPVAKFLHYTHMKQAFRSEQVKTGNFLESFWRFFKTLRNVTGLISDNFFTQNTSSVVKFSVLSSLLPEAAIFYLDNYGAEKYAEVYLGEFDHPEIIWNSDMR